MKTKVTIVDNEDRNWGEVELFRQLHRRLPRETDTTPFKYSEALLAAAKNVQAGEVDPFNASEMLKVAGLKLRDLGQ